MNFSPFSHLSRRQRNAGFSLIEVTLAIGIVAFAFISLFGLLPTGLNVFRGSIDTTIGSQIVQQVTDNAQQTDFTVLVDPSKSIPRTYYDEQGNQIVNADDSPLSADQAARSIYTVQVTVNPKTLVPAATGSGTTNYTSNVATLTIQIAKNPGHDPQPFTSTKNIAVNNYVAYVARNLSSFNAVSTTKP